MKYNFIACCLFASLLGAGCTAETEFSDTPAAGQLSVILQPAGLQGTAATTDDKRMNDVKAFRFDDGQLQETYGPPVPGDDGRCYLNLADEGYLNQQAIATHPQDAATTRFDKQYNTPLSNTRETIFYICEQQGTDIQAEVLVRFRNALHKLKATLPTTIRRNTVYTIHVYGRGGDVMMTISNGDWEQGDTSGSEAQIKAKVNVEASALLYGEE